MTTGKYGVGSKQQHIILTFMNAMVTLFILFHVNVILQVESKVY